MASFPFYRQLDQMDCGPTCVRMIAQHHGRRYTLQNLRERAHMDREGISLLGISQIAEDIGMRTLAVKISYEQLAEEAPLPAVAHWNQNHFVVVHKIKRDKVYVADPAHGLITYKKDEFINSWGSDVADGKAEGIALLMEPSQEFYELEGEKSSKASFGFLFRYFFQYKKFLVQLMLGLLLGSLLQLVFPFLTQAVVDFGIGTRNIGFIYLILIAQLVLFASQTAVEFIRAWILIHLSTRINISIISDFLIKLMRLPIGFFDAKQVGDLIQRIQDHHRIESFLTGSVLTSLFSIFNILIFGIVLAIYSIPIFLIFLAGSSLYIGWVLLFLRKRAQLDHKSFAQMAADQSNLIQLITGMQEIKLNNIELQERWRWERIQAKLFRINLKKLALSQYQQGGGTFFNQVQNIIISFVAAKAVIDGDLTLGMMMAITYITGQLNAPIGQIIAFVQQAQDAKISLERLGEIHSLDDEEEDSEGLLRELPPRRSILIENLSFRYGGPESPNVLEGINLEIPEGKTTAIVGMSGSGKTTLIKLLLKFYEPQQGHIQVGAAHLNSIASYSWREACGTVMQEGFIFSDTIAHNIALEKPVDKARLLQAVQVANIQKDIEGLPLAYNTKIGQDGIGLSGGQKQRLLIARAVYKNPEYLFFDEATSALDANNEAAIMEKLNVFLEGRTVVVVAHRLSTVKNADQIVVLDKGKIVERGTHTELTALRGAYYTLVKNQLELGS
jgi:ATP-binding cassette subfamily B protein